MKLLDRSKLQDVRLAAQHLLGCEIHRQLENGEVIKVRIVETESYHQEDPASHTFKGQTKRNEAMFGQAGHAYIYFTYGMHWCFNVTAGPKGYGAGVLIRAAEPVLGLETIRKFRGFKQNKESAHDTGKTDHFTQDKINLTNGPAKLAQALNINKTLYGHNITKPPLQIFEPLKRNFEIVKTTRIGISQAVEEIARYYIKDNIFVSKK